MEGQTTPPVEVTPTPAPAVETTATPTPTPTVETSYSEGGALGSITSGKMNLKDIVISALLITLSIYGIFYYRKANKKLDEQPTSEEFDNMSGDIEEVKYNLKKALGKKYETT